MIIDGAEYKPVQRESKQMDYCENSSAECTPRMIENTDAQEPLGNNFAMSN